MQDLSNLPPILQIVLSIGMFAISVIVYIVGNIKKVVPPTGKDVIVPSVSIVDRESINRMVESFTEANKASHEVYEAARDMVYELKSIAERIEKMERNQRAQLRMSQDSREARDSRPARD
jgi:hypothetical protein